MQVDGNRPLAQRDMGLVHDGPGLDAEVTPAIRAAIGHVVVTGLMGPGASAMRAVAFFGPQAGLEPGAGRIFIGEHVDDIKQCQPFSI